MVPALPASISFVLVLSACGRPADDTGEAIRDCGDPCLLSDENNYAYSSQLDVDVVTLQSYADVEITWPDLSTDLLGDPIAPDDITKVTLVVFKDLSPSEVAAALADDTAKQSDVALYQVCTPTGATCKLSEFGLFGSYPGVPQYFAEGTGTWLLVLGREGETGGAAMVMMQASDASAETSVVVDDDTFSLSVTADLTSARPVGLPVGPTPTLDWSGLTRDGFGHDLDVRTIDRLEIGRYDAPLSELQLQFVALEQLATARWTADTTGAVSIALDNLSGDTAFDGIDADNTWLLALGCSSCISPAPRYMAVLAPPD